MNNRFYRQKDDRVSILLSADDADQLLSHLCEVETLADIEPEQAAQLHNVRMIIASAIIAAEA